MRRNNSRVSNPQRIAVLYAFIIFMTLTASAQNPQGTNPNGSPQTQTEPTPQVRPTPSLESRFLKNILNDQRAIWTAPFRMGRGDMKLIAPLGLTTAVLLTTDRYTAGEIVEGGHSTRLRISKGISYGGSVYAAAGIPAAFYLIGRASNNARARETGLLSAEALIDSSIVSEVLKAASQRPRPLVDDASGEFFDKGNSFPSGHAISAWSVATVIAYEYGEHRPLVRFGLYGLASAVSISRFTARRHFLSDALVGSAFGYGIGRYVYRTHHDASLDSGDGAPVKNRSKLIPLTSPLYSRAARSYGLALAWDF